ncbi:hypothetical protein JCM9492_03170 [Aquifex pyrophilus]
MKKLLFLMPFVSISLLFSGDINTLLKEKGCLTCHDTEKSKIGPPFKVIAKEYKGKKDAVEVLVKSITSGSVGKWQGLASKYGIKVTAFYMPRQSVTEEEAKKIVEWILSLEK